MADAENATPQSPQQPERPVNSQARAKRLYAHARLLEQLSTNEQAKEAARDVALLALDMMLDARVERSA